MGMTEDLAEELATEAIKYIEFTGDEEIIAVLSKSLGTSSHTAEEAFMTAIRVRRANSKARALLARKMKKAQADLDEKMRAFETGHMKNP